MLTPTYHVFRMYVPFQDATFVPVTFDAGTYTHGSVTLPRVDAIAARDRAGKLWLAVTNLDPNRPVTVEADSRGRHAPVGRGADPHRAEGRQREHLRGAEHRRAEADRGEGPGRNGRPGPRAQVGDRRLGGVRRDDGESRTRPDRRRLPRARGRARVGRPGEGRLARAGPLLPPAREAVGRGPADRQRPPGRDGVRGRAGGAHPAERGHVLVRRAVRPDQPRGALSTCRRCGSSSARAATRRRRTWPTRSSWDGRATCRRISRSATCGSSSRATSTRPTTAASWTSTAPSSASATGSATPPSPARSSRARPTRRSSCA